MIIELEADNSKASSEVARALGTDINTWPVSFPGRSFVVVSGDESLVDGDTLSAIPGVIDVVSTQQTGYHLVRRDAGVVTGRVVIGGTPVEQRGCWLAAGPCTLENIEDAEATAKQLVDQPVDALRVGIFKPRTSPYNFQGRGLPALDDLVRLRDMSGLPLVTEVLDPRDVAPVAEVVDCLQVGTRNMTNQALLAEIGRANRPVLLKRGAHVPVDEWLRAAEFVITQGNEQVVLCARGMASFDKTLRFTPDLGAIMAAKRATALPVIFDPSHVAGRRDAVGPMALAAAAAGADGLIVECHVAPDRCYEPGDGPQQYDPTLVGALRKTFEQVRELAQRLDSPGVVEPCQVHRGEG
jgi:3-deoxy-7-phosphoheptulonate synthase